MKKVSIRYLPIFKDDLVESINYIRETLLNDKAANDLIDEVEKAILNRSTAPKSFEQYHSLKEREHPYYRIYVKNYVVYYVVIPGDPPIMEIRRFLYVRRNKDIIV